MADTFKTDTQIKNYKFPTDRKDKKGEPVKMIELRDETTEGLKLSVYNGAKGITKTFFYTYFTSETPTDLQGGKRIRKKHKITIGEYPFISLTEARQKALALKEKRAKGETPTAATEKSTSMTFEALATEYYKKIKATLAPKTYEKDKGRIKNYLTDYLATRPIKELTRRELIEHFDRLFTNADKLEAQGKTRAGRDTIERTFQILKSILKFAVSKGFLDFSPLSEISLKDAFTIKKREVMHQPCIKDPARMGEFLRAIRDDLTLRPTTRNALFFAAHTALRSKNISNLKWDYIDFEKNLITLPATLMKSRREFRLPMSRQTRAILEAQKAISGGVLAFPGDISAARPMSENTLNQAIKRLGFGDETVLHGLRATFSTLSNLNIRAHGFNSDLIDLCLDHNTADKVSRAYNHADPLDLKRDLMQWYSDYLDEIQNQE